jgi:3-oxoacid CoA-transferase subunit B
MVARAAGEIEPGQIVNLGIGMPTEVANHVEAEGVVLQTENGLLGMGPFPFDDEIDPMLVNAGKQTVTARPGASTFDSALSFAMIRGGRVDLAILGGLEVAANGDLANWTVPGKLITGMGGAMDLAAGAKRLVVLQSHTAKDGTPKLVARSGLPLTATACVSRVITELGVFEPHGDHFVCVGRAPGVTAREVAAKTGTGVRFHATGAQPDFDLARARDAFAQDEAILREVLELFVAQVPESVERLRGAVARRDLKVLATEGHALKGSILATAALPWSAAVQAMETAARAGQAEKALADAPAVCDLTDDLRVILSALEV